ncbi:type II toxin-antitoxin system RelE/ParE family toxin [Aliirhizobium terrae]|nr:type II toxin-antitoxin system RelE/ParE family toxin [Rhizobium sp. CC-CFT758]WJH42292.1 type II toxin-antitoxin system RelE/ParE family toxin [Rhizobium sp. CC-CFT758]
MAADDPVVASHFVRDLTRKIEWIATTGFQEVLRDNLSPGLKALPYRKRCIYFRTTETTVRIVRVLHGHQNLSPDLFRTEQD